LAGRPREFDHDAALSQIQKAFWARGYEGTSMADLVQVTGLASARLYAAFGSKEAMFRAAVERYERREGAFADRAFAEEPTARQGIERMLRDAVALYTGQERLGCMVVSAATNCSAENDAVRSWLEQHRKRRAASITARLRSAVAAGELRHDTDVQAIGDVFTAILSGLSVQARDGVPRRRLLALIEPAMTLLVNA
jgi:AcrR family transcriptional regulator